MTNEEIQEDFKINQLGFKCKYCGEVISIKDCVKSMLNQTLRKYTKEDIKIKSLPHLTHIHNYHECKGQDGFSEDVHLHIDMPEYKQDEYELVVINDK